MTTVLASAADERYGNHLLNMLGSVEANSPLFDRIVVYDLGLSSFQRRLASSIRGVELRTVPPFVPHWAEGRTWKPWIWTHLEADVVVWLDAGLTVLRSLEELLAQVSSRRYFVVAQGHSVADVIPSDYYELYGISHTLDEKQCVAAGILAFEKTGAFYEQVIAPTFDDAVEGRSLGASAGELEKYDFGMERMRERIIRDCPRFRHEQTLLNIHLYRSIPDPVVNDLDRFAGWQSPRDHPEQVIWSHRRRGDFRYLTRVPYKPPVAPLGLAWGAWFGARWWARNHSWLFRPATYIRKARRLAGLG